MCENSVRLQVAEVRRLLLKKLQNAVSHVAVLASKQQRRLFGLDSINNRFKVLGVCWHEKPWIGEKSRVMSRIAQRVTRPKTKNCELVAMNQAMFLNAAALSEHKHRITQKRTTREKKQQKKERLNKSVPGMKWKKYACKQSFFMWSPRRTLFRRRPCLSQNPRKSNLQNQKKQCRSHSGDKWLAIWRTGEVKNSASLYASWSFSRCPEPGCLLTTSDGQEANESISLDCCDDWARSLNGRNLFLCYLRTEEFDWAVFGTPVARGMLWWLFVCVNT